MAGPYDFLPIKNVKAQPVFNHPDYPANSQPIDYVSPRSPPAFLGAAAPDQQELVINPQADVAEEPVGESPGSHHPAGVRDQLPFGVEGHRATARGPRLAIWAIASSKVVPASMSRRHVISALGQLTVTAPRSRLLSSV